MRCPKCGGIPHTELIDREGKHYYHCTRPLHRIKVSIKEKLVEFLPLPFLCNTFIGENGKRFAGHVAYVTGGKLTGIKL
jgi:hypothetical protein